MFLVQSSIYQWTEEVLKKKKKKAKIKVSYHSVYELLHDSNHHYKLSIINSPL